MPWSLKRYQQARCLHFITFSCYHRAQLLGKPAARDVFEDTLEQTRRWYGFYICGYVVMPEHVHLLVSEPERTTALHRDPNVDAERCAHCAPSCRESPLLANALLRFQRLEREETIEKLRYMHRNPVKRGLVETPGDWLWSSFRHYVSGYEGAVEIESQWKERKREKTGVVFQPFASGQSPHPVSAKNAETRIGPPQFYQPVLMEE